MLVPMPFFMMLEFYNFYTFEPWPILCLMFWDILQLFFNFVAMATYQIYKFKSHFERAFNYLSHDITHVYDTKSNAFFKFR